MAKKKVQPKPTPKPEPKDVKAFQGELEKFGDAPPVNLPPGITEVPTYRPDLDSDRPESVIPDTVPDVFSEPEDNFAYVNTVQVELPPKTPINSSGKYQVYRVRHVEQPGSSYPLSVLVLDNAFNSKQEADTRAASVARAKPNSHVIIARIVDILCLRETVTLKLERKGK